MKIGYLLSIPFVLFLCIGITPQCQSQDSLNFRQDKLTIKTRNKSISFKIEVAETRRQRARGLMWRSHLANGTGMLFDFQNTNYVTMWMKNTYFPLDIIYINKNGLINNIIINSTPHSTKLLSSEGPVRAVLELSAGAVKRHGIQKGDTVIHSIFKP